MEQAKVEGFMVICKANKWQPAHTNRKQILRSHHRYNRLYYFLSCLFFWGRDMEPTEKILPLAPEGQ